MKTIQAHVELQMSPGILRKAITDHQALSIERNGEGSRLRYRLQHEPRSRLRDLIIYPLLCTYGVWQIEKMLKTYDQS